MLGVTGPNEYENNVNNNWYTSYLACWCLEYTLEVIEKLKAKNPAHYTSIVSKLTFSEKETVDWQHIIDNMYYAYDESRQIFLQQDGYLDKEQILVKDLDPSNLPLNQKWSWDRILRSCYINRRMYFRVFISSKHDLIRKRSDAILNFMNHALFTNLRFLHVFTPSLLQESVNSTRHTRCT